MENAPEHVGLGSGSQTTLSIGKALSNFFDLDMTLSDIANIFKRGNLQNFNINENNLQDVRGIVKKINLGKSYWKHCIILTLLFLLIEILLVKFIKS